MAATRPIRSTGFGDRGRRTLVVLALLTIAVVNPSLPAGASDTTVRWEAFSESPECGEPVHPPSDGLSCRVPAQQRSDPRAIRNLLRSHDHPGALSSRPVDGAGERRAADPGPQGGVARLPASGGGARRRGSRRSGLPHHQGQRLRLQDRWRHISDFEARHGYRHRHQLPTKPISGRRKADHQHARLVCPGLA